MLLEILVRPSKSAEVKLGRSILCARRVWGTARCQVIIKHLNVSELGWKNMTWASGRGLFAVMVTFWFRPRIQKPPHHAAQQVPHSLPPESVFGGGAGGQGHQRVRGKLWDTVVDVPPHPRGWLVKWGTSHAKTTETEVSDEQPLTKNVGSCCLGVTTSNSQSRINIQEHEAPWPIHMSTRRRAQAQGTEAVCLHLSLQMCQGRTGGGQRLCSFGFIEAEQHRGRHVHNLGVEKKFSNAHVRHRDHIQGVSFDWERWFSERSHPVKHEVLSFETEDH